MHALTLALLTLLPKLGMAILKCENAGPQSPRDITVQAGSNPIEFPSAPPAQKMNLCNIHTHTNAEHKGEDYRIPRGTGDFGGFGCNSGIKLSKKELENREDPSPFANVKPGDSIEVHWVYTTCNTTPGVGLDACVPPGCESPKLRVEAQVFLLVNNPKAAQFQDYVGLVSRNGFHQSSKLPTGTGEPVIYLGSTTGTCFDDKICSPAQVTWSVRPFCQELDISSLYRWAQSGNVFKETASHGSRALVTNPAHLSKILSENQVTPRVETKSEQ